MSQPRIYQATAQSPDVIVVELTDGTTIRVTLEQLLGLNLPRTKD